MLAGQWTYRSALYTPDLADDEAVVPRRRSPLLLFPAVAMLAAMAAPARAEPGGLLVRVCSGDPGEYVMMRLPVGDRPDGTPDHHDKAPCHAACPAAPREPRRSAA